MRRLGELAAVVLVAALVLGCGNDKGPGDRGDGATAPAAGIVGSWVYYRASPASASTDAAGSAFEEVVRLMPKMEVEYSFAADGTFTLSEKVGSEETSTITGTWELRDGKYVVTEKEKNGKP